MARQDPRVTNAAMRSALLASAPRMRKNLGAFTGTFGQSTRIKLFNVGIVTFLQLLVVVPVTIGTATATASAKAPYNAISRIRVTDYDGTDRVNLSGFQLFVLNCVRNRIPYGYNNEGPFNQAGQGSSGIITFPAVPTAVGNGTIQYQLDVPLAYDPENDLRGAILAQTAVGEMYLTVDWASSYYTNGDVESLYSGGASTTVVANGSPSVTVYQEYLLPQNIGGGIPLPMVDLMTVYELNGNVRSSDNLATSTEKLISYPNYRSVIGAYVNYINGGAMAAGTDVNNFRLIANGNNVLRDYGLTTQLVNQRNYTEGDLGKGIYYFLHRTKPIETALFGNVQLGFTPSSVSGGNTYLELFFESFYTKGAALPGVVQGT